MFLRLLHLLHFSLGETRVRAHDARGHKAHKQHRGAVLPGSVMHSTLELGGLELFEKGRCSICVFVCFLKVCLLVPWSSGLLLLFLHETDPTEPNVVNNIYLDIMLNATMACATSLDRGRFPHVCPEMSGPDCVLSACSVHGLGLDHLNLYAAFCESASQFNGKMPFITAVVPHHEGYVGSLFL